MNKKDINIDELTDCQKTQQTSNPQLTLRTQRLTEMKPKWQEIPQSLRMEPPTKTETKPKAARRNLHWRLPRSKSLS